jgi:hypothetical protein
VCRTWARGGAGAFAVLIALGGAGTAVAIGLIMVQLIADGMLPIASWRTVMRTVELRRHVG